jgi:hypothetical protein
VGHLFSPSSLEAEDNLLRLDRALADLLSFVDERIGLERTLIVLSADHGGPEAPGYLQELGIEAFHVDPSSWNTEPAIEELTKRFGAGRELILKYEHPYVYLDQGLIRRLGLDAAEVERAIAEEIVKLRGVALAVASSDLREGRLPSTPLNRAVLNNFHPNQRLRRARRRLHSRHAVDLRHPRARDLRRGPSHGPDRPPARRDRGRRRHARRSPRHEAAVGLRRPGARGGSRSARRPGVG